jgi:transcriptional regulator with XRE-family HTH domain
MLSTKIIGERITEARKKITLSQAQLAERLFISSQAVGKWERGESMPDIITLNRLAEILGVDLNYFSEKFPSKTSEEKLSSEFPNNAELKSLKQDITGKKIKWNMSHGNWVDADFSGLNNLQEKFSSSNIKNCLFVSSNLSGLLLSSNHVVGCNFSDSNVDNSHMKGSHLANNVFKDCSLKETEFSGSYISNNDFSGTDFSGAEFKAGGFEKSNVTNAIWNNTSFREMYIADIVFEGIIENCAFENCAFKRVTFQNLTLTNTFFKGKNLKGIRFIDCKADQLTYAFLKNGKADLNGIELVML